MVIDICNKKKKRKPSVINPFKNQAKVRSMFSKTLNSNALQPLKLSLKSSAFKSKPQKRHCALFKRQFNRPAQPNFRLPSYLKGTEKKRAEIKGVKFYRFSQLSRQELVKPSTNNNTNIIIRRTSGTLVKPPRRSGCHAGAQF